MQSYSAQVSEDSSLPVAARTPEDLLWLWLELSIKRDRDFIDIRPQTQILEDASPNETLLQRRQHAEIKSIHGILSLGRAEGVLTRVIHPRSRESRLLSDGQRKRCLKWIVAQQSEYCENFRANATPHLMSIQRYSSGLLDWGRLENVPRKHIELEDRSFEPVDWAHRRGKLMGWVDQFTQWFTKTIRDQDFLCRNALNDMEKHFSGTQVHASYSDVFEEPFISGHLQGANVSAFPDTGATTNFISQPYAQQHGIKIDESVQESVKVGDGSTISVVGTTTLSFSFAGETTKYDLTFHVLRRSLHAVILGSPFLHASGTLTRFAHRMQRKIRETVGRRNHRVCLLGSHQYVKGQANGIPVDAIPDTGADVSVMSERFAKSSVFEIDDDEQHQISLEFVDGSTARARGVVKDVAWRYGVDEQTHPTNVYVLPNLPTNLVLGYGFLRHTQAFVKHEHDFRHAKDLESEDTSMLGIIRKLQRARKGDDEGMSSNAALESWQSAKTKELDLYQSARDQVLCMGLSRDETAQLLELQLDRYEIFMASMPGTGDDLLVFESTPSSYGSIGSPQIGQMMSSRRFSIAWFGRKLRVAVLHMQVG